MISMAKKTPDEKMEVIIALEERKVKALERIATTLEKLDDQIRSVNPAEMKKRAHEHKKAREKLKRKKKKEAKNNGSQ